MYEELADQGLVVFTVALERCAEDPKPFIERANPTHPSVIDVDHRVAELYNIVNVPTILWIDESGRICRPHDSQFGTDTFTAFHGKRSAPYLELVRRWVREGEGALSAEQVRRHAIAPTADNQAARAEWTLAWHLHQQGLEEAAARHFDRAGELAPLDWTIRRGSMPIRGMNPFGPEFFALAEEGKADFPMDEVTPTRIERPE